jgi:nitric oxide reductase NorE protein
MPDGVRSTEASEYLLLNSAGRATEGADPGLTDRGVAPAARRGNEVDHGGDLTTGCDPKRWGGLALNIKGPRQSAPAVASPTWRRAVLNLHSTMTTTGKVPGEAGVWVFIFGDITFFACLFVVYLDSRRSNPELFGSSRELLDQNFGVANTLVLLTSSLFVVLAGRHFRAHNRQSAGRWFAAALVCGALFVALKAVEYQAEIVVGRTFTSNVFFTFYFLLTGLHLLHLILGMAVLTYLFVISRRDDPTRWHTVAMECGSCYWHMVDFLWIIIFPLLYLIR